jgi:hypothetical protein
MSSRPGTGSLFGTGIYAVACKIYIDNSIDPFRMTNGKRRLAARNKIKQIWFRTSPLAPLLRGEGNEMKIVVLSLRPLR